MMRMALLTRRERSQICFREYHLVAPTSEEVATHTADGICVMDNDPKNDRVDYAAIRARLAEDAKRLGIDPDDTDVRPEQIARFGDWPEFDPKAHPHLLFLAHATIKIESGKIDDFRDPANLKKIRAVKDYASSTEKHAAHVQGELDKFMERLKKQEDEKNAYLTSTGSTKESAWLKGFLKAV
jgi:hypothetical protein